MILTQLLVLLFKRQTEREIAIHYGEDRGHCGRCEYDLTGNVSGICSECGWQIPGPEHRWERIQEMLWWKRWRITYLENWRRSLRTMVFNVLMFLAMTVWFALGMPGTALRTTSHNPVFLVFAIVLPAFMCVHMLINAVRIA